MLKTSDIRFNEYISKFYTFTKWFHGNPTFLMSCVMKTNFGVKKGCVRDTFTNPFYNLWKFRFRFFQKIEKYEDVDNIEIYDCEKI
jgi:hypothetical protein